MAIRKNPKADLRRTYGIFVEIGMVVSLLLLILAFRANIQRAGDMEIQSVEQEVG